MRKENCNCIKYCRVFIFESGWYILVSSTPSGKLDFDRTSARIRISCPGCLYQCVCILWKYKDTTKYHCHNQQSIGKKLRKIDYLCTFLLAMCCLTSVYRTKKISMYEYIIFVYKIFFWIFYYYNDLSSLIEIILKFDNNLRCDWDPFCKYFYEKL